MTDFPIRVIVNPAPAVAGARRVRGELAATEAAGNRLNKLFTRVFQFAGLGFGLNQIRKFSDSFIELQNRLRVAGFETNQLASASQKLIDIAVATRSPLDANARLLGRIGIAAQDLGASQEELFRFVELTGKGLAIQGASAQEARSSLTQLAQALGSGIVRAEEFNSVSEGAIVVLQGVAKSMNVTVSGLRKLVAAGKVTSQQFFRALLDSGEDLDKLFKNVAPTIGQAFVVLETQFIALTGTLEQQFGALSSVARAMLLVANNLNTIIPILIDLGAAFAAIKLFTFTTTLFTLATASGTAAGALNVLAATFPRLAAGVFTLNNALLFLARNPLVAVVTALGLAVTFLFQFGDRVKLTADGTITLASVMRGLATVVVFLATNLQVLIPVLTFIITLFGALQLAGVNTLLGAMVVRVTQLTAGFLAWGASIVQLQLIPFLLNPITLSVAAITALVAVAFNFRDAIVEIFPPAQTVFNFIIKSVKAVIGFFGDLIDIIKEAAKALGVLGNAGRDAGAKISSSASAAAGSVDKIKKAADSSRTSLSRAATGIATDFASASNSASGSLNTLANNARSVASNISSSMKSAASSVARAGGSGRGLTGTGTGTSINTGSQAQRATVTIPGMAQAMQRAIETANLTGGTAERNIFGTGGFAQSQQGTVTEVFKGTAFGVSGGDPLLLAALQSIQKTLSSGFGPRQTAGITRELVEEVAAEKFGRNPDASTDALRKTLGLSVKSSDALQLAAVSLQTATADLSNVANAPIWLTGNPFEAFRQNVFGFATGGSGRVGGSGGPDSKLVALALTPGELVDVKTPAQQRADEQGKGAGTVITQNITYNIETTDADSFGRNQTQIIGKTLNTLNRVQRRL